MARHRQRRDLQQEAGALVSLVCRRSLLLGGVTRLGGTIAAHGQTAPEYAVFTEFSRDTKPMKPGWNRRVFTNTDARKGNTIQCDFATGIVSLAPGTYHLSVIWVGSTSTASMGRASSTRFSKRARQHSSCSSINRATILSRSACGCSPRTPDGTRWRGSASGASRGNA
jgi:hypothetical protein